MVASMGLWIAKEAAERLKIYEKNIYFGEWF